VLIRIPTVVNESIVKAKRPFASGVPQERIEFGPVPDAIGLNVPVGADGVKLIIWVVDDELFIVIDGVVDVTVVTTFTGTTVATFVLPMVNGMSWVGVESFT